MSNEMRASTLLHKQLCRTTTPVNLYKQAETHDQPYLEYADIEAVIGARARRHTGFAIGRHCKRLLIPADIRIQNV